jgi:Fur family transcriptional regulator, ferric uptake regulator
LRSQAAPTHRDLSRSASPGLEGAYRDCRNRGLRLSRQRRLVLEILWRTGGHLSARDIFEQLNADGRRIGHTSVYQNLESLHLNGVIECLDRAGGRLYGHRTDPHSHLTCLETGHISDLDIQLPPDLLQQIEAATGFEIESYSLQLQGRPRSAPA